MLEFGIDFDFVFAIGLWIWIWIWIWSWTSLWIWNWIWTQMWICSWSWNLFFVPWDLAHEGCPPTLGARDWNLHWKLEPGLKLDLNYIWKKNGMNWIELDWIELCFETEFKFNLHLNLAITLTLAFFRILMLALGIVIEFEMTLETWRLTLNLPLDLHWICNLTWDLNLQFGLNPTLMFELEFAIDFECEIDFVIELGFEVEYESWTLMLDSSDMVACRLSWLYLGRHVNNNAAGCNYVFAFETRPFLFGNYVLGTRGCHRQR